MQEAKYPYGLNHCKEQQIANMVHLRFTRKSYKKKYSYLSLNSKLLYEKLLRGPETYSSSKWFP